MTFSGTASGSGSLHLVPTLTTLVNFEDTNGFAPDEGLITDAAGNLFGTTYLGGANGDGTVFEISKISIGYASTPTTLVSFNAASGFDPEGGLIADAAGDLFGMTGVGGANGDGTVFEVAKTGGSYARTPTTLVSFKRSGGFDPEAGLIADAVGDIFGTTVGGGANDGTVFELVKNGGSYTFITLAACRIDGGPNHDIGWHDGGHHRIWHDDLCAV